MKLEISYDLDIMSNIHMRAGQVNINEFCDISVIRYTIFLIFVMCDLLVR